MSGKRSKWIRREAKKVHVDLLIRELIPIPSSEEEAAQQLKHIIKTMKRHLKNRG